MEGTRVVHERELKWRLFHARESKCELVHARESKWRVVLRIKQLVLLAARHSGIMESTVDFPTRDAIITGQ